MAEQDSKGEDNCNRDLPRLGRQATEATQATHVSHHLVLQYCTSCRHVKSWALKCSWRSFGQT